MSSSTQTLEPEHRPPPPPSPPITPNPNNNDNKKNKKQSEEWVQMTQSWLSTFPEGKTATLPEFESWFNSNHQSLPSDVKLMPRPEIYQILMSIQKNLASPLKDKVGNQLSVPPARFQRTDQWLPVYSWLESLNADEVVKSKDIADWLTENPAIREELSSRHSRYHLMHYIKKCHVKILKRHERKKELQNPNKGTLVKVQKPVVAKQLIPVPCDSLKHLPKDGDIYLAKRQEALQKYGILVELENQLSTLFPKHKSVNCLMES